MENKNIRLSNNILDIINVENSLQQRILSYQSIADSLKNNTIIYIVYYIDNVAAGYLAYSDCIDHIDIISIAVKPEHRRKGIAKLLFIYLKNLTYSKLKILLEVRKSNFQAIHLYESLGFKCIYIRKDYYLNPKEDALIYSSE